MVCLRNIKRLSYNRFPSNASRSIQAAKRLKGFEKPTFWAEFSELSARAGSVNLGQGFPNWESPKFVKDALSKAVQADFNQYCRPAGDPELMHALADHYSPLVGREIDPMTEVTSAVGATEALFGLMQAILNEGEEVILVEPTFDIYPAQIQLAGGICRYAELELIDGEWKLDFSKLESLFSPATKVLLLNTPHNPTGKMFSRSELEEIASILRRHPHVTAIVDEVYEKITYDGREHLSLASLPDMWNRTVTVSSVGKTFSCTGWKAGWAYGGSHLSKPLQLVNQWVIYCLNTPTSRAVAEIIRKADEEYEGHSSYFEFIRHDYQRKKDILWSALNASGLNPIKPEGGFFIMSSLGDYEIDGKYFNEPGLDGKAPVTADYAFARWLTHEWGVTPIPSAAFYSPESTSEPQKLGKCSRENHDTILLLYSHLTMFSHYLCYFVWYHSALCYLQNRRSPRGG